MPPPLRPGTAHPSRGAPWGLWVQSRCWGAAGDTEAWGCPRLLILVERAGGGPAPRCLPAAGQGALPGPRSGEGPLQVPPDGGKIKAVI